MDEGEWVKLWDVDGWGGRKKGGLRVGEGGLRVGEGGLRVGERVNG